jgi:hypothetical protein
VNSPRILAFALAFVTACGGDAPVADPVETTTPIDTSVVTATTSRATRLAAAKRIKGVVGFDSAGPLRAGMSLAQAVLRMEGDLWTRDRSLRCANYRAARAPGLKFLFLDRHLARIEVESGPSATAEGVRIGSTVSQVQSAYAGRVTVTDDASTGRSYLSVRATDASDSAHRLVFEANGSRIVRFRSGVRPSVEWIEGCS